MEWIIKTAAQEAMDRLPRCAPRLEPVRADKLQPGDRVIYEGRIVRILRIRQAARIEAFVQSVASPETGDCLKFRSTTRVERFAA